MVLQRWCIFKVALKSFTVLDVACTFVLLGPLGRPAASKTGCTGQQRPLSFSTPQSTSPIVYERLLLLGCIQKQEKTQEPGCAEASKVKRARGEGVVWGGKNEKQKFLSFPAGVFQIPQATASRLCEWSKQPEGKLKRTARGREPHSWGDASPTHRIERHSISVTLPGKVCNRLCSMAFSFFAVPCHESLFESLWHWHLISNTNLLLTPVFSEAGLEPVRGFYGSVLSPLCGPCPIQLNM